jgi:hypothetical protein
MLNWCVDHNGDDDAWRHHRHPEVEGRGLGQYE